MGDRMKILKQLYDKNELYFALVLIGLYCLLGSLADSFSVSIGIEKIITCPVFLVLSMILICFINKNHMNKKYGLIKPSVKSGDMLYYVPLVLLMGVNLWHGISISYSLFECLLFVLSMLCVGFIEEIIFRGFLYEAMKKDNLYAAIIVSSLTFGIGHIINLFNGSHMNLFSNVLQIMYATSTGFMFVIMYEKTKSLYPCIITHSLFNAFSLCMNETVVTPSMQIIDSVFIIVLTLGYAFYIMRRKLYEE